MKTIGYIDKVEGCTVRMYVKKNELPLFRQSRHERIKEAFRELKGLGNVKIVLVDGNKTRIIGSR